MKLNTHSYLTWLSAADPVSLMVTYVSFASSLPVEIIYLHVGVSQHLFCHTVMMLIYNNNVTNGCS